MPPFFTHLKLLCSRFIWGPEVTPPINISVEIYKRYSPLHTIDSVPGYLTPHAYRQAMRQAKEAEYDALRANLDMQTMRAKTPWIDYSSDIPRILPLGEPASATLSPILGAGSLVLLSLAFLGGGLYLFGPQMLLLSFCGLGVSLSSSSFLLSMGLPLPLALVFSFCLRLLVISSLKALLSSKPL